MIQDITPEKLDLTFKPRSPSDSDIIVAIKDDKVLFLDATESARLPRFGEFNPACRNIATEPLYMFSISGTGFYCSEISANEPAGYSLKELRYFIDYRPGWEAFGGVTASHLGLWYAANKFCGACGSRMDHKEDERALQCPRCGMVVYPRISPVVIVGVVDDDRILLAQGVNSRLPGLIAGFVEIGETLEDTVRREVMEETGLRVKNIRYYQSQPWSFTQSLLMGFYADLDGSSEVTLDQTELVEADWRRRDELSVNENPLSLTATLIEAFRTGDAAIA